MNAVNVETSKVCFKCGKEKQLSMFYRHVLMKDGHLNKCIECTRKDVAERYYNPIFRTKIAEYERMRSKTDHRKSKVTIYQKNRRRNNPQKALARNKINNALRDGKIKRNPCRICGDPKTQAHHSDYSNPMSVEWLCFKHHREIHNNQIVNQ